MPGPSTAAEAPVQRVDQNRQIGFPGVAWPDEHCEGAQIHLRLNDRTKISHFNF